MGDGGKRPPGPEGGTVKYALLIHEDEAAWASLSEEDLRQIAKEYVEFTDDLVARGLMRGGEQFQPSSTATTVRGGRRRDAYRGRAVRRNQGPWGVLRDRG
jgi:hypothetical protein